MNYRYTAKPKKVIYIDVSEVPAKHVEWFMKGAQAAMKAVEEAEEKQELETEDKEELEV